jgi:hypothetical protein
MYSISIVSIACKLKQAILFFSLTIPRYQSIEHARFVTKIPQNLLLYNLIQGYLFLSIIVFPQYLITYLNILK